MAEGATPFRWGLRFGVGCRWRGTPAYCNPAKRHSRSRGPAAGAAASPGPPRPRLLNAGGPKLRTTYFHRVLPPSTSPSPLPAFQPQSPLSLILPKGEALTLGVEGTLDATLEQPPPTSCEMQIRRPVPSIVLDRKGTFFYPIVRDRGGPLGGLVFEPGAFLFLN